MRVPVILFITLALAAQAEVEVTLRASVRRQTRLGSALQVAPPMVV